MNSRIVTYSSAYTIVPTYECFNRCTYCNFRSDPGQSEWISLEVATDVLQKLKNQDICEILILSGEVHPNSSRRCVWFQRIYDLCALALSMGFLPHTNVGILSFSEMENLKSVNVSMGLMLEQITPKLMDNVHKYAPSKVPGVRLQQLEWAGQLKIPFTTGLLLGIGEKEEDWWDTLVAISHIHQRYQHIQEVILQPHSFGGKQSLNISSFEISKLPGVIAKAREILPEDITIQIPPNLVNDAKLLLACLDAGARDLGGIGPKDEVNPEYQHIHTNELQEILHDSGWKLIQRLPIYPHHDAFLLKELQTVVEGWRDNINNSIFY
ncbi:7,8-didemethyl-8-hydroxy-5-deazariboflavin synthase subunit CofG [Calothrix sp. PCC 6303]|uniref:7,8-didemethyl-8-hydroxy-5-deazariboflavin synthase subunit CofG n=1 Tax=Calothrix sp. PCC 6303 TaxID=1170562 RepID=UPI0002A0322A|nr:7,8-didemethyl-8-hydroxy-5-deazariboflavin synthase subunit CofG [Calothrix sp. PCC 6303]AFY99784.1 FO synthase subunit 1 [Calothrix sp. PCC 6303]